MDHSADIDEMFGFLGRHQPFSNLSRAELKQLLAGSRINYFRRGSTITTAGSPNLYLSIVRSGAVELRLGGSSLNSRLGEGECFGYPSLIRDGPAQNGVVALEDSLLYRIAREPFLALRQKNQEFRAFFDTDEAARLRRAVDGLRVRSIAGDDLGVHGTVGSIIQRDSVVTGNPRMSVADAARLMGDADVSTLPVTDDGKLVGILTDKDLRRRVLATGVAPTTPLDAVMTRDPVTVSSKTPILTALVTMAEGHFHHLPITDADGGIVAVISSNDILVRLGSNSILLAKQIASSKDPREVARSTSKLPQALTGLVDAGVDADHVSRYVSTIGEGAHRRLLELAQEQLGPPPVAFALVCFGSLARGEQALGSDQDNGFIFAHGYDADRHCAYFEALAQQLCDGLDGAGWRYCPGEIMATNPAYRRTVADWLAHFHHGIETPDPQAILESTIFFDMRCLAGEAALVEDLRSKVLAAASANRIFLSFVARAAAATRVPLGFFRNFLLQDDADEGKVLDLKGQAIAPIVDFARVHALAGRIDATNTLERLHAASHAGQLAPDVARDLAAAFEFVRDVRFRHQVEQLRTGDAPSSKLPPSSLSRFDREHLRDAFRLTRTQLDALRQQFAGGLA